ncbi:MAG: TrmH family RNA methyltransferase [Ruminiclostridium sp.]
MPEIIKIDSLEAAGAEVFCKLTEAQLRNKLEKEKGIFIAESPKVINVGLERGFEPLSLLMDEGTTDSETRELLPMLEKYGDIPIYSAGSEIFAGLTGFRLTRGILCAMRRPLLPEVERVCENARRIAVLENIADAMNVGAIFRSAAALGIEGVLLTPDCCDPLNRRSLRVSMGTVLQIPWTYFGGDFMAGCYPKGLNVLGFKTAAMALSDNSVSIDDKKLKSEERLAIILGSEGHGLPAETIRACDYTVKIPMFYGVDSLNVAAASAVAFWELRAGNR